MKKTLLIFFFLLLSIQHGHTQYKSEPICVWGSSTVTFSEATLSSNPKFKAGVEAAANTWSSSGSHISLVHDDNSDSYINYIDLGASASNADTYMRTAYDIDDDDPIIEDAVMSINSNNNAGINWLTDVTQTTLQVGYTDVWSLALHEFGHWFWLDDNTTYGSIMYASNIILAAQISPHTPDRAPSANDISAVSALYSDVGVEDAIVFNYTDPTSLTQNSYPVYTVNFDDEPPLGDYLVGSVSISILVEHGEGEYVASTGTSGYNLFWHITIWILLAPEYKWQCIRACKSSRKRQSANPAYLILSYHYKRSCQ